MRVSTSVARLKALAIIAAEGACGGRVATWSVTYSCTFNGLDELRPYAAVGELSIGCWLPCLVYSSLRVNIYQDISRL